MARPKESGAKRAAYLRIVETISERIHRGQYRAGDQLPSESQFCSEFDVSAMTLRRALAILAGQGLVSAEQGRGTFVRSLELGEATFKLGQLTARWMESSGDVRLLAASTIRAGGRVAEVLGLNPGDRAIYLRRLLLKEGEPVMYHKEYVIFDARRPLVESQLQITSLAGLLRGAGGEGFPRGELTVRAVSLDAEAAQQLGEPVGAAALCLEHVFRDYDDRAVSWGWFLCRADAFYLQTTLGATPLGASRL
jgi:GntR family transcriptional regulator